MTGADKHRRTVSAAVPAVLFAAWLTCGSANATIYCHVKGASASHVILRAQPRATARPLGKIPSGELVQAHETVRQGWIKVTYRPQKAGRTTRHPAQEGWLPRRVLGSCG
jgi:hypothetical protein